MNYFYLLYCIILYCIVLKVQNLIKSDNENDKNWKKKLVALNNKVCWFMVWAKPFKGKTRIEIEKKWENAGKTRVKPAWNVQSKCSNNTQGQKKPQNIKYSKTLMI